MTKFIDISTFYDKIYVLVFGSYHPKNKPYLENLIEKLRNEGFIHTFLANEIIKIPEDTPIEEREIYVLNEINKEMQKADFNIFIFFSNNDVSASIELSNLIHSNYFLEKKATSLVLLSRNVDAFMLKALLKKHELKVFYFHYYIEIYQKIIIFIKQNLINILRKS